MRCWNYINENKQYRRAGACYCRFVGDLINGEKRANTVRPYDWIFKHYFKIRTPTMPSPFEKLRIFREGGPRQRWMRCWNLTGGKKRETPGEGFPLALRAIHPSCALRTQKGVFRSLRRATKGAAFGIRHPLKRVDRNFIIWCGI